MVASYSRHFVLSTRHDGLHTSTMNAKASERLLLWVDAVGGYLVCPAEKIVLGQAVPGAEVDVPLMADLSNRHATICRDGENYLILPIRPIRLAGREVESAAVLADGQEIELGRGVKLRFRRPHPLSATARLEFASHHRTQPPVDSIILMADTCVLGPTYRSHVVCRGWSREVVLFRQGESLGCRTDGDFEIDGVACHGQGPVTRRSRIAGDDFAMSLEPV